MLIRDLISKVANDVGDPFFILAQKASYVAELNELSKSLWRDVGASIVYREKDLPADQSHYDLDDRDVVRFVNLAISKNNEPQRVSADIKDFAGDVLYYVNEKAFRLNVEHGNGVWPNRGDMDESVQMTIFLDASTGKYRFTYPSIFGTGRKLMYQALVLGVEYTWDDETMDVWDVISPCLVQGCIYRMARNLMRYTKDVAGLGHIIRDAKEEYARERRETIGLIDRMKDEASSMLVVPHFWLGGMDYSDEGRSEYFGSKIGT